MSGRPDNCITCGWRMRGTRYTAQQAPGTRVHSGGGQCTHCRRKEREAQRQAAGELPPTFDAQFARYALNSWLANLPSRKART